MRFKRLKNIEKISNIDIPVVLNTYIYQENNNTNEYYVGFEIASLLGYKYPHNTVKNSVSKSNQLVFRDYNGEKNPWQDPRTILISQDEIQEILQSTRKKISPFIKQVLNEHNIYAENQSLVKIVPEHSPPTDNDKNKIIDDELLTSYTYINNGLYFEYFIGFEITTLLDYKDTQQSIRKLVSKSNQLVFRDYPGVKNPPQDPRTILITRDGVLEILRSTRKLITPSMEHILKKFQFNLTNCKKLAPEQKNLSFITNSFKIEETIPQYPVGKYRLDLYFPKYKIVIECNENGHNDRNPNDERERVDYVNKELSLTDENWIRFNPDDDFFDVARVIGQIHLRMVNYNSGETKRCCTCRKEKNYSEFHKHKNRPDGCDIRCKDCKTTMYLQQQEAKKQTDTDLPEEKHCFQCETTKPRKEFWKSCSRKDGLSSICIECNKADKQKYKDMANKVVPEYKVCSCCKECKETVNNYGLRSSSIDGYMGKCKECNNKWLRVHRVEKKLKSRKCTTCKEVLSPDRFGKRTRGLSTVCKKCMGES